MKEGWVWWKEEEQEEEEEAWLEGRGAGSPQSVAYFGSQRTRARKIVLVAAPEVLRITEAEKGCIPRLQ